MACEDRERNPEREFMGAVRCRLGTGLVLELLAWELMCCEEAY